MNYIINFVIRLLQRIFYDKPQAEHEQVHRPTDSPERWEKVRALGRAYSYDEDGEDKLVLDTKLDSRLCDKSLFVVHFAGHNSFEAVVRYLTQDSGANSTFISGRDAFKETVRTVPSLLNPSWTQGLEHDQRGGALQAYTIDDVLQYRFKKQVNNFAVSTELIGKFGTVFSLEQYEKTASLIWHCLEACKNFRIWQVIGHEHILPEGRNDPGSSFDWSFLFEDCLGVESWFYDKYLSYLAETAQDEPGLPSERAARIKLNEVRTALDLIAKDLVGKDKNFGLKME